MRRWIRVVRERPRAALAVAAVVALVLGLTYVGPRVRGLHLQSGVDLLPFAHSGKVPGLQHPHIVTVETIGELRFRQHRVLRRSEKGAIPTSALERDELPLEPPE